MYVNATLSPSLQEGATSTLAPARTFAVRFEHTGVVFADEAFSHASMSLMSRRDASCIA